MTTFVSLMTDVLMKRSVGLMKTLSQGKDLYSIYKEMSDFIKNNSGYWTDYNPEKVNMVTKHDALVAQLNQRKVGTMIQ